MTCSQQEPIKEIIIDGVEYVPKATVFSEECLKALRELYTLIWIESCYDAFNDATEAYARKLLPHIRVLNDALKFKK